MYTYEDLINIQFREFPSSHIVTMEQFIELHKDSEYDQSSEARIREIASYYPAVVFYYLKHDRDSHILPDGGHYNGIRFGDEGDYYSMFYHVKTGGKS